MPEPKLKVFSSLEKYDEIASTPTFNTVVKFDGKWAASVHGGWIWGFENIEDAKLIADFVDEAINNVCKWGQE